MKILHLNQLAAIERAVKDKAYAAGSTLVALSATNGQTMYLDEDSCVDSRWAVITPRSDLVLPYYLYLYITKASQEFIARYKTGLNLQISELDHMEINLLDLDEQKHIVKTVKETEKAIEAEDGIIQGYKDMKTSFLNLLFP